MELLDVADAELVGLGRGGDIEATAGLLERYRPSLYAAAIGLLRNREEALDAVQETCVTAIVQLNAIRDPSAVGGWLHAVLRNTCFMRLRRSARETSGLAREGLEPATSTEELVEGHALRDWIWSELDALPADDRLALVLRHFTRCESYNAIAAVSGVPVGTVRSRLHRARAQLARALTRQLTGSPLSRAALERERRVAWEGFYARLHEHPVPRTYRDAYATGVAVTDGVGAWLGIEAWSAHEREAIALGVRARIVGLVASRDFTILEIDFSNPDWAPDHCPPRSTFVHRMTQGRSKRLDIHYV